jgi:raffinose/stachyose/melibiose transport system permease protein
MSSVAIKPAPSLKLVILYAVLTILALIVLVPFILVLLNSFKDISESSVVNLSLPKRLLFSNYSDVFEKADIFRAMKNGIIESVISVIAVVLFSSMAAFVIIRRETKVNKFLYTFFVIGLIAPFAIVPAMKVLQFWNIMGTYTGIIAVFVSVNIPFSVFLYAGFIKGIPRELDESAVLDGAKPLTLFFRIIFPLLQPVIATSTVLVFMNCWNDFTFNLYFMPSADMWNMPLTIFSFMSMYSTSWNLVCADIMLTILPILIVYLFAQKYIIAGMTSGAVKG